MMLPGEVYDASYEYITIRITPTGKVPVEMEEKVVLMPAKQAWALWSACIFALLVMIVIGLANALNPPSASPAKSEPASSYVAGNQQ